jgi:hypothetical protein|tara:strand:- start:233 stop:1072 length:840 start_codon:yes stop_codon:yes gene_type:complete
MSVPFMWVDGNLTVILKNKAHQVIPDHTNYKLILEALPTATEDELLELVDIEKAIATFSQGQVSIVNGKVMFEGEEVHGSISKRIIEFMSKGLPFQPLVNFLENLMKNPSMQSQQELYDFLEHENLPVTEDGCFLAYKAVNSDFKDKWRGTFDNKVGQVCEMRRAKVDDNRGRGCSAGLHAGALNYVANYGNVDAGDNIVIVKINPEDVVSVPSDCNCEKLRTCKYEVVGLYQGELPKPLYKAEFEADSYVDDDEYSTVYDEYDEDYWDQFEDDEDEEF